MIECRMINGRRSHLIVCDVCHTPISDIRMGMVAFDEEDNFYFYHKITCDPNNDYGWTELSHFLERLWHNAQLDIPNNEKVSHESTKEAIDFLQLLQEI